MQAERIQQIRASIARMRQATANMANNGGLNPRQQLSQQRFVQQQKNSGEPFVQATASGRPGLYIKLRPDQQSKAQASITAYPQLEEAVEQITQGIEYSGTNFKGDMNKLIDAASAYAMNEATPKQIAVLSKSGIALDAITRAAETASLVMNQGKTNETMHRNIELFAPRKGDTAEVYANRVAATLGDFKDRFLQSQYHLGKGEPLIAVGRDDADENASREDMQTFIANNMGKSFGFRDSNRVKSPANSRSPTIKDHSSYQEIYSPTDKEVVAAARKKGVSPEVMSRILNEANNA